MKSACIFIGHTSVDDPVVCLGKEGNFRSIQKRAGPEGLLFSGKDRWDVNPLHPIRSVAVSPGYTARKSLVKMDKFQEGNGMIERPEDLVQMGPFGRPGNRNDIRTLGEKPGKG